MPAFRNWHARWSASGTSPVHVPTVRTLRHCSSKRIMYAPVIPRSNFQNIAPMFRISHALLHQEDPRFMCPACPASPASLHAREDQLYAQLIARSNFKNATRRPAPHRAAKSCRQAEGVASPPDGRRQGGFQPSELKKEARVPCAREAKFPQTC